jgi:tRNA dimethylallyltransferase
MDDLPFDNVFILTGPTATGKSQLALILAEHLRAEIIAMDSMTLYRGMDIGTAKPSPEARRRVAHHLIDVLEPWESASVAWWLDQARKTVDDLRNHGKAALFVGGTPLYLKALLRGLFAGPPADARLRAELEAQPSIALYRQLTRGDPASAARLHPHDKKRIVRALEVLLLTGIPISQHQQQFAHPRQLPRPPVWLNLPRDLLYRRINSRVDQMIAAGFVKEVRRLASLPRPLSKEASQAVGYRELLAYLTGDSTLGQAIRDIQLRTRHFAKRQLSWFRHLEECRELSLSGTEQPEAIAKSILTLWRTPAS